MSAQVSERKKKSSVEVKRKEKEETSRPHHAHSSGISDISGSICISLAWCSSKKQQQQQLLVSRVQEEKKKRLRESITFEW